MKSSLLILVFSVFAVLVMLFSLINYSNLVSSQSVEGVRGAYFTKVGYPATVYEGQSCAFSFTVYNKNCTANEEGNASFYFIFYVDSDVWLNEYNSTSYKIWQCNMGASVMRGYAVPPWFTMVPDVHDVRVELYSYYENVSQLQDVVSFPVSVILHVAIVSMIVSSCVILLGIVLLFLGYYMVTHGPIEIFSSPKNVTSVSGQQSAKTVSLSMLLSRPFMCFYLFVLASWQMIGVLFYMSSFPEELRPPMYLIVEMAYVVILVSLIGKEGSGFKGYGFLWPDEGLKYVAVSLLLAVSYSFIIIIVPGISAGYDAYPPVPSTEIWSVIFLSLVASFAAETIFRGYIQSKLLELSGFPRALIATSVLFTLYMLHFSPFDFSDFLPEAVSLFAMGIFLGALFYRTKTLLCPIIFYFVSSVLDSLLPFRTVSSEYSSLFFECVALVILYLLLEVLVLRKHAVLDDEKMFFEELQTSWDV
jgi:membrane protease YdiL (CAAX protease family)